MSLEQVNELYDNVKFAPKSVSYRASERRFSAVAADGSRGPPSEKDAKDFETLGEKRDSI